MPPKFKQFAPGTNQPFVPSGIDLSSQGYHGFQSYQSPAAGRFPGNQSPGFSSPVRTGSSTPVTNLSGGSSSASLSSLASALKDIEQSPVSDFFDTIRASKNLAAIRTAAGSIAETLFKDGSNTIKSYSIFDQVLSLSRTKTSALAREGALLVTNTICRKFGSGSTAEAYLSGFFSVAFDLMSDKENSVKRAAQSCIDTLYSIYPNDAKTTEVLSKLLEYLDSSGKWQGKIAALKLISKILEDEGVASDALELRFLDAIPVLTGSMHDFKPELSKAGTKTLTEFAQKLDNQDIAPRIPIIIKTLSDHKNVPDCIKTLSHVTFVAEVTEPALAILVPILIRALNQSSSSQDLLRQTVIVVENLTRLVHNPREVKVFIPQLMPGIKKVVDTAALPEVRELAAKALAVLEDAEHQENAKKTRISDEEVSAKLVELLDQDLSTHEITSVVLEYISQLITSDVNTSEWNRISEILSTYIEHLSPESTLPSDAQAYFKGLFQPAVVQDTSDEGIEVVNAEFSLAYGGKMLLNKTFLRLFKGHRYGLCGRNGAGKSTLMRSISEGKLEGFPDKSEVRTCFVEHKLQGTETNMDLVSFIASDPDLTHVNREDISGALAEVGFDEQRRAQEVGALSGGWKMKLELARAMLMKADILLLDEPTNHLDVANVKWLQDYLITHTEITSLIVSHDSSFLDAVCTDIIHYENKKLAYYKGNLSE